MKPARWSRHHRNKDVRPDVSSVPPPLRRDTGTHEIGRHDPAAQLTNFLHRPLG